MIPESFWKMLEHFALSSRLVIDRPKGSLHPRFPELVYPLDYGYLAGTTGSDGEGIDVWYGVLPGAGVTGFCCTLDPFKRDAEVKILLECSAEDAARIRHFLEDEAEAPCALFLRPERASR